MRVRVDPAVCEANGVCERLAPEVYELDEDDELHIKLPEPPPELWDTVRETVVACPKQALAIEE
jgi:ferredoxin